MGIIRIVKDGIELSYVKETLSIRKENNSLIRDLKISHTNFPFLLPENKNLKLALGPRDITSLNKTKTVTVQVYENDVLYSGELQILSYLKGYRKANLKFASPVLSIMNKKISDFMPKISVTGATTGIPDYVTESDTVFTGDASWPTYVAGHINQGFPAVKWNFPTMLWRNKFGENLESDDAWINYKQKVNLFIEDVFQLNTYEYVTPGEIEVVNQNVPMPQVYLLSPLFYALQSLGFEYSGNFVTNAFIKKIMLLSFKDNLTKVLLKTTNTDIIWDGAWSTFLIGVIPFNRKREIRDITESGTYSISINFTLAAVSTIYPASFYTRVVVRRYQNIIGWVETDNEVVFRRKNQTSGEVIEGEFTMDFIAGDRIYFDFDCVQEVMPLSYTIGYRIGNGDKDFYQMHPTIDLGRYLPNWTVATYLNNIKNWFNLKFDIDDLSKKVSLNFNEDWLKNQQPQVLRKSMAIKSYDPKPIDSVLLKFENDEDTAIWIDDSGADIFTNQESFNNEVYDCKFKFVPNENSTALLSEALEDKSGVGLMIYDEQAAPLISESYNGKTLKIEGAGGIYESYWKLFIRFRLNASVIEMEGAFTKTEIGKFIKAERIYTNNQDCIVSLLEYKELNSDYYRVTFKVETFNL
jgi:hypothetical protein